jgi:hypothetical protein
MGRLTKAALIGIRMKVKDLIGETGITGRRLRILFLIAGSLLTNIFNRFILRGDRK